VQDIVFGIVRQFLRRITLADRRTLMHRFGWICLFYQLIDCSVDCGHIKLAEYLSWIPWLSLTGRMQRRRATPGQQRPTRFWADVGLWSPGWESAIRADWWSDKTGGDDSLGNTVLAFGFCILTVFALPFCNALAEGLENIISKTCHPTCNSDTVMLCYFRWTFKIRPKARYGHIRVFILRLWDQF
jgi:hypothetical protein